MYLQPTLWQTRRTMSYSWKNIFVILKKMHIKHISKRNCTQLTNRLLPFAIFERVTSGAETCYIRGFSLWSAYNTRDLGTYQHRLEIMTNGPVEGRHNIIVDLGWNIWIIHEIALSHLIRSCSSKYIVLIGTHRDIDVDMEIEFSIFKWLTFRNCKQKTHQTVVYPTIYRNGK